MIVYFVLIYLVDLAEMLAREKSVRVILFGTEEDVQDAKMFFKKTFFIFKNTSFIISPHYYYNIYPLSTVIFAIKNPNS